MKALALFVICTGLYAQNTITDNVATADCTPEKCPAMVTKTDDLQAKIKEQAETIANLQKLAREYQTRYFSCEDQQITMTVLNPPKK